MSVPNPHGERQDIASLEGMRRFAGEVAALAGPRLLLLLDGPMGAGKTQFTRFFMEALGSKETCSPSFSIHNQYQTPRGSVEHVDLYRMESEDDLESTGFWDFFLEKESIVIIEWAERLKEMDLFDHLPRTWPRVSLRFEIPEDCGEKRIVHISA